MRSSSIDAYDLPERVAAYDADMELMHPNRARMVEVALQVLPFPRGRPLRALDLGVGTAYFSKRFLEEFPASHVVAVGITSRVRRRRHWSAGPWTGFGRAAGS